ncbi:MAG TPA: prolipoprotein diacylglyceryl transferase [Gammaproteobacteria bacterium]|nr:prolipoprotein diacylglyceryl transferase [Gammaproteobacteria bacterium]
MNYPQFDPVAFHLGSWPVYWYGLMYLFGFVLSWVLLSFRVKHNFQPGFKHEQLTDLLFYGALGVIIGGRVGYMVFYDWRLLFSDPLLLFQTWKGGMSFHGGLIGVTLALWWYARKANLSLFKICDFIAPVVPVGLGLGRIGNFINGELWGRVTDVSWAMVFPAAGSLPRHPSQLYEFSLEGVVLFLILWIYSSKPRPSGAVSGLFLFCYGIFRSLVEFYREPDSQIGLLWGIGTEGQLLSLPMILFGIILLVQAYSRNKVKP